MGSSIFGARLSAVLASRVTRAKGPPMAVEAATALLEWLSTTGRRLHSSRHSITRAAVERHLAMRALRSPRVARVLALGADGALACVEALEALRRRAGQVPVEVVVVDDDGAALDTAAAAARERGLGADVQLIVQSPWEFVASQRDRRWDVVEATGILDTVPFHEAMVLIRSARRGMLSDGLLVASQLQPEGPWPVERLLRHEHGVFRRSPIDFEHLLRMAGFFDATTLRCSDPRGVCSVALHGPESSLS